MDDRRKTKEELIRELRLLRKKVKRAEQSVVRSSDEEKKRLIELLDASPAAVTVHDAEGNFLYANQRTLDLHGYTREEFMGLNIRQVDTPESAKMIAVRARQVLERGEIDFEATHFRKDRSAFPLQVNCRMTSWGKKKVVISVAMDITDRKEAEASVRRSEEKYRDLFENANDVIFLVDADLNFVDANKKAVELLAYSREEILRMNILDIIPAEQRHRSRKEFLKLKQEGKYEKFQGKIKTKDGRWLDIEVSSSAIFERGTFAGSRDILRDVTEQARTERSLRESESRLKEAQRIARIGDWAWDVATNKVEWSEELYRIYGYEPHEIAPDYPLIVKTMHPDSRDAFLSAIDAALKGERGFEMDYAFFRKDGSVAVLHTIGHVIRDDSGSPARMVGTVQEITGQKKAEQTLRESEEKFKAIFDYANDGILIADAVTKKFIEANRIICAMLGYTREEITGLGVEDIHHKKDLQHVLQEFEQQLSGEKMVALDVPVRRKDSSTFYADICTAAITLGGRKYSIGIFRDITERRRAAEALRRSETMLQAIIDAEPECVKLLDSEGRVIMMNRAGLAMMEVESLEQVKGMQVYPVVAPEYRASFSELTKRVFQGKSGSLLFEIVGVKGTRRWLDTHAVPFRNEKNEVVALLAVTRDVTERKAAEQALRASEERLSKAQKIANVGCWEKNLVTGHLYWSEEVFRIYGVDAAQFTPTTDAVMKAIHPDDRDPFTKALDAATNGQKHLEMDYRLVRPDGTVRTVHTIGEVSRDPAGRPLVHSGTIQDITDQKLAEEKLRQSEKFVRTILDTVDEGFIVIDRDFRIMTANKAYCGQVGEACEKVIGAHCYEMSHKSKRPCHEEGEECPVRYVFTTGEPYTALHRHTDANESVLFVETKAFPIKDGSGSVVSVIEVVNNVTEKHLLEEVRVKAQKLEAIGTLAGGIAHDYNNMLQGVFGYLYMAKTVSGDKERTLSMLEQAEQALNSCANLTKQLLTFSKGGMPVKKPIMIEQVIEDSVKFALSGSGNDYSIAVDPDLWMVEADEGQIAQVIQNIAINADQAMPQSGTIMITVKNSRLPRTGPLHLMEEGNYIEIAITDTGVGIPDLHLAKIFDPYFTTKPKGSGLGLATSYSIVKNHGGMINVVSEVNKGTTVLVYLPALEAAIVPVPAPVEATQTSRAGRILIMDDDQLIREIAGEMLKTCGHEVEAAEHGEEAIEKYQAARRSGKPFDIVILDLTIRGGLGGKETINRLHEIEPGIRAIVSSGYSEDTVVSEFSRYGFMARLTKPYKFEELRATVNSLIV